jgi:uncharacterized protein YlzI (FlbEa/FlbD family)
MGICLSNTNTLLLQDEKAEEVVEQRESFAADDGKKKKKKMVRFQLQEDDSTVGRGRSDDHGVHIQNMGICLSNTNTLLQAEKAEEVVEQTESFAADDDGKKKKMVRFKLQEDDSTVGRGRSDDHGVHIQNMGICLSNTNTLLQAEKAEEVVEQTESFAADDDGKKKKKKKKMVRFKLQEDDSTVGRGRSDDRGDSGSGVVRIRVVVTLEELKQLLDCKDSFKQSSVEQLVSAMKLRGRRVSADQVDDGWRPALESIPEDP